ALALRLARLLSVALGTASVGFTIAIARLAFPKHPWAAVAAGGFMAFCPQFLFMSGVVNNDNLLILAATVSVWQTLRILRRPTQTRLWAGLGVWLGIAILAKPHGAAVLGTCGIALLWHLRATLGWRPFARRALVSALPIAGITLWWFVRNQVVYGDPLGVGVYESIYWMNLRTAPLDLDAIWAMVTVQFQTFWAAFGWTTVIAPTCYYLLVGLLQVGALVGVVRAWRRGAFRTLPARRRQVLGVLALACVVQYAFVFCTITRCNESCYQGRYLFPALSGLSVWLTVGLAGPDAKGSRRAVAAAALLLVAALYLGAGVLRPAFVTVPLPKWRLWLLPNHADVVFGKTFRLRGYEIEPDSSGRMTVTLYWEALRTPDFDYSVFTHVLDQEGERVAQADQLPGLDQDYPPTKWLVGDIVRDRHVMDLAALDAGEECVLWIGLYDWSNGERLAAEASPGQTVQENALVIPLR
ncbi:MAG: ArnT family glycosyltransferase, partial [Anaerolineae bacterium]